MVGAAGGREIEPGLHDLGHREAAGAGARKQLRQQQPGRTGSEQQDVGDRLQAENVETVHDAGGRFREDGGLDGQVVDGEAAVLGGDEALGKAARRGDALGDQMPAERRPRAAAFDARAAGRGVVEDDPLAEPQLSRFRAEFDHLADDLVPGDERIPGSEFARVQMQLRAADAGHQDAEQNIARPGLRVGKVTDLELPGSVVYDGLHDAPPCS